MKLFKEFKDFTLRGNVLDLAIGIVIGAAFASIVNAVVENLLMPIIGILTGGVDFKSLSLKVGEAELRYGLFIQATVSFVIIAFFLFLVVKAANTVKLKTPIAPPSPSESYLKQISEDMAALRKAMAAEVKEVRKPDDMMLEQ